jgi:hypothetical protein
MKHPEVITLFPTTIENHTMLLEEGGFSGITAKELVRYVNNICMYVCIPYSSSKVRLVKYLRNVGSVGLILAWQECMTLRLLPL